MSESIINSYNTTNLWNKIWNQIANIHESTWSTKFIYVATLKSAAFELFLLFFASSIYFYSHWLTQQAIWQRGQNSPDCSHYFVLDLVHQTHIILVPNFFEFNLRPDSLCIEACRWYELFSNMCFTWENVSNLYITMN